MTRLTATLTALVLAGMVWLAARSDHWSRAYDFAGQKSDYYNLLVDGFREGHLYMRAEVSPELLSPDPAVRQRAPYLLDASLYHGRYYLYFGVVPALLLFLPYALLTAHGLPENAASVVLVAAGFLFQLRLYLDAKRRYFPGIPRHAHAGCMLLLAFGTATPVLLTASGFYEIAIGGAYCFLAAGWLSLFRAWHAERDPGVALGLASLAFGLAVGCRPNAILAFPALAAGAAVLLVHAGRSQLPNPRRIQVRLAVAAVVPAAIVGLGLMVYNCARFGSPLEFGFHYQMSQLIASGAPLARFSFFWPNLTWYYLRPPVFSLYFPYVFPMNAAARPPGYYGYEQIFGQWPSLLLLGWCAVGLVRSRRRQGMGRPGIGGFVVLLAGGFACLFVGMACFGFRSTRYIPDFQGSLVLMLVLLGGYCAGSARPRPRWGRLWRTGFTLLAVFAASFNLLSSFQLQDHLQDFRPRSYRFLAYYGDYPAYLLTKWGFWHYGPVRFHAIFHPTAEVVRQPLLATGTPGYSDVLYVAQYPNDYIGLMLDHEGYGGPSTGLIPVERGREYAFEVDLGSLYPPRISPAFRGWSRSDIEAVKTTARVLLDGREVLAAQLPGYDSPPNWVFLGRDPARIDPPFSGRIVGASRLQPRRPDSSTEPGVWRFQIEPPAMAPGYGYPILGSGVTGHGNLLTLRLGADGKPCFGFDQWGGGMSLSPPLDLSRPGLHRLEIFVGPAIAWRKLPAAWRIDADKVGNSASLLRIWLDGVPVWTTPVILNQDSYDLIALGSNPQGFSNATMFFMGTIRSLPYSPGEMKQFIFRNLGSP